MANNTRPGPGPNKETWSEEMERMNPMQAEGMENTSDTAGNKVQRESKKGSWAQVLSSSLPLSWNKNVLEIVLEKDVRGPFNVSDVDCARMMRKLGLDIRPWVHVESVQICPNGRGLILITLKKDIAAEQFCRYDVLELTESGIRGVNVKPAGKREQVINMKGIHPNTREDGVIDYINRYGQLVTDKVVYGVFTAGPLKGFRNSDRAYKVELKPGTNIGTYHVIDGHKVTARYAGQKQTCARCFETALRCPGRGIAKNCEAGGGPRIEFVDYIKNLWSTIGYSPENVELSEHLVDEVEAQHGGQFTPLKQQAASTSSFAGVNVKAFPKEPDHGAIVELLIAAGLPEAKKDSIHFKLNGTVTITNLSNDVSMNLISYLHNCKFMGKKLFCNGIVPLTPNKEDEATSEADKNSQKPHLAEPDTVEQIQQQLSPGPSDHDLLPPVGSLLVAPDVLVRRNSLSMRSPPRGSLVAEILSSPSHPPANTLARSKSLLADLKEMSERLSDFGSCRSSSSSESESETKNENYDGYKTMNEKREDGRTKES